MKKPQPKRKRTKEETESEDESKGKTPTEFSFTLTQVAVSQICRSVGFKSAHLTALQTLTLISTKYLQHLARWAASFSHMASRTDSNLFDLTNALYDLSSVSGFPGAPSSHANCLLKCGLLKDLSYFVSYSDEIPFAKPIPRPNRMDKPVPPAASNEVGLPHIPKWLPALPNPSSGRRNVGDRSDEFWENSGCGGGVVGQSVSRDEERRGGGELPNHREKVRFKLRGEVKAQ